MNEIWGGGLHMQPILYPPDEMRKSQTIMKKALIEGINESLF